MDVSFVKYEGNVHVITDRSNESSNSELATSMAFCMGISSVDVIFERDRDYSKYVVYTTYCIPREDDNRLHGLRVLGRFVVYIRSMFSPANAYMDRAQLGGRLALERMATLDTMVASVGGSSPTFITPGYLDNDVATSLWTKGCPICIVNVRERDMDVIIQRCEEDMKEESEEYERRSSLPPRRCGTPTPPSDTD